MKVLSKKLGVLIMAIVVAVYVLGGKLIAGL